MKHRAGRKCLLQNTLKIHNFKKKHSNTLYTVIHKKANQTENTQEIVHYLSQRSNEIQ